MVEDCEHEPTVPEESLHCERVDRDRWWTCDVGDLSVGDCLGEGKVLGEEGDEDIHGRPVRNVWKSSARGVTGSSTLTFLENDHISKELDVDTALFNLDQTSQDFSHGLASRLDIHRADSKHNRLDI
jgi:hypothetical protein